MKVAIVTGAIAPYTHQLYESLAAVSDIDLSVMTCTETEPNRFWAIPAASRYTRTTLRGLRFHINDMQHVYLNPSVLTELARLRPGLVVLCGFSPTMLLAGLYALATRTPIGIATDGSLDSDPGKHSWIHRLARRLMVPRAVLGFGASQSSGQLLMNYGLPPARFHLLPIVPAWPSPASIPSFDQRPFDLLFCGTIDDRKGALFFADVATRCKQKLGRLSVRIAGDGPLRGELEARLAASGIAAQFDGYLQQHQLAAAYSSAKLFLFPSRNDPWGLVANEAILCGTPVIASPHAVSSIELVAAYEAGEVRPLDVQAWSEVTARLLADPEQWAALQANHAAAREFYTLDRAVGSFKTALGTIRKDSPAPAIAAG